MQEQVLQTKQTVTVQRWVNMKGWRGRINLEKNSDTVSSMWIIKLLLRTQPILSPSMLFVDRYHIAQPELDWVLTIRLHD